MPKNKLTKSKHKKYINIKKNKSTKKYTNKSTKKSHKFNKKYRGGDNDTISFLYVDKDIAYILPNEKMPDGKYLSFDEVNDIIKNSTERDTFEPTNIFQEIDIDRSIHNRISNVLYLINVNRDFDYVILGYVYGYIDAEYNNSRIVLIELHENIRGRGFCTNIMDTYIKEILKKYTDIKLFSLYNSGGEPSCRCYIKAFEQNGFRLNETIDCKRENKMEMAFNHL